MVTLYLEGETKTTQLTDWSLYYHNQRECLQLSWRIDGKSLTCPFSACRIEPAILATGTLLIIQPRAYTSWSCCIRENPQGICLSTSFCDNAGYCLSSAFRWHKLVLADSVSYPSLYISRFSASFCCIRAFLSSLRNASI